MTPCEQHARGLHMNDFSVDSRVSRHRLCKVCGLQLPDVAVMAVGPTEAIIRADRDWYILELES